MTSVGNTMVSFTKAALMRTERWAAGGVVGGWFGRRVRSSARLMGFEHCVV